MKTKYSYMSDSEVDAAFAAYYDSRDMQGQDIFATEIVARMSTIGGMISGLMGRHNFPEYEKRSNFIQSEAARSSVKDSAVAVANAPINAAVAVGGSALKVVSPFIYVGIAVAGIVGYMLLRKK